jgi:hypothetical protein
VKSEGAYSTELLKFKVRKKINTSNNGNAIRKTMNALWFAADTKGSTTVPLTSAIPAKIAMIVKGFLTVVIFSVISFAPV